MTLMVLAHFLRREAFFRCHLRSADEFIPLFLKTALFDTHTVNLDMASKIKWDAGKKSASSKNKALTSEGSK